MITFDQLALNIQPAAFFHSGKDLHDVADKLTTADVDYRTQILRPIASASFWSDSAQPDATAVLTVMTRAFETASTQMAAGASALATLSIELAAAQKAAQALMHQAGTLGLTIAGGKVQADEGLQHRGGAAGSYDQDPNGGAPQTGEIPGLQGLVDVAVQRAEDADKACSAILKDVAWADFFVTTHNDGNIVARANAAVEAAYGNLDKAAKLPTQLAQQAQRNVQRELHDEDSVLDHVFGVIKGLWSGVAGTAALIGTLGKAAVGDDEAQRKLGQIVKNLSHLGLGDLINVQLIKEGRVGKFIGSNLWWFVPGGAVVKGGKVAGRLGKAAGTAGGYSGEALKTLAKQVPGGTKKAISAGTVGAETGREILRRNYPNVWKVNAEKFEKGVFGHNTNCAKCAVQTDRALAGKTPDPAGPTPPGAKTWPDITNRYGKIPDEVNSYDDIVTDIQHGGSGARGLVYVQGPNGESHIFNVVNEDGAVVFIDGQTGTLAKLTDFSHVGYLRTG